MASKRRRAIRTAFVIASAHNDVLVPVTSLFQFSCLLCRCNVRCAGHFRLCFERAAPRPAYGPGYDGPATKAGCRQSFDNFGQDTPATPGGDLAGRNNRRMGRFPGQDRQPHSPFSGSRDGFRTGRCGPTQYRRRSGAEMRRDWRGLVAGLKTNCISVGLCQPRPIAGLHGQRRLRATKA